MFLWNNIFFSLGFDVKDHYKDFGGDAAAYVAPVSAYAQVAFEVLFKFKILALIIPTHNIWLFLTAQYTASQ